MDQTNKLTGFKKRQQIEKANKTIFLWVAIASVVVSVAAVLLQFLVREAIFNQKIINAKSETNQTLKQNIENAATLKKNIDNLLVDRNLSAVRTETSNNNLKVILDALPSTGDATTFANSLQNAILNQAGTKVGSLSAGTSDGSSAAEATTPAAATGLTAPLTIPFTANLTGDYRQVKASLLDIERVIRPMNVQSLTIQGSDTELNMSVTGVTYYQPGKTIKLGTQTIKP